MKKNMEKEVGKETDLVRISLGSAGSLKGPGYLKPGHSMSFETNDVQIGGIVRLIRLGVHPNLKLISVLLKNEPISNKQLEEGFLIEVGQRFVVTVKNEDEGRFLCAHPLFSISSRYEIGDQQKSFDCLIAADSIAHENERAVHYIRSGNESGSSTYSGTHLTLSTHVSFLMKVERVFIHTFSVDEEFLMIDDVRMGKNSVFVNSSPISATHFSERFSPLLSLGILQEGQLFSVILRNRGPSTIAFTAELEGRKIELP
jgi:hypothetical protein